MKKMEILQSGKRYCFDLDGVLAKISNLPYSEREPLTQNILFLNKLYIEGNYIIIHTARRMKTHNSNIGKVVADIASETAIWLKENNVPYHELHFGKPYADFYIDDNAVRYQAGESLEYKLDSYNRR
jgi:capsule biosynthesis phosphatase